MVESVNGEVTLNWAGRMKGKAVDSMECGIYDFLTDTLTFFVETLRFFPQPPSFQF